MTNGSGRGDAGLPNLEPMFDEMRAAPEIVRPSMFWESLNERNVRQLSESGFESFKQTINRNYFQFLPADPRNEQFQAVLRYWFRRPSPRPFSARFTDRSRLAAPSTGSEGAGARALQGRPLPPVRGAALGLRARS